MEYSVFILYLFLHVLLQAIVLVLISDINDNDPVFDENFYTAIVVENVDIGTPVKNVTATDADSGDNGRVWYEIISGNINNTFKIDNVTGEIFTQASINYEAMSIFSLVIKAEDFGNRAPRRVSLLFNRYLVFSLICFNHTSML